VIRDGPPLADVTTAPLPELDPTVVWSTTAVVSTAAIFPLLTFFWVDATVDEDGDDAHPAIRAPPRTQITADLIAPNFMVFSFLVGQR
jgi:hypothetical protein